ncbi:MAG: TrkH family potassium uptake protein [Agathobacter sp.]
MQKSEYTEVLGKMMILEGMILLVPFLVLPFYGREVSESLHFLLPAAVSILAGILLSRIPFSKKIMNSSRIVVFAWIYGFLLAAVPFHLHGGLTPVQALFESVSGFTTTGLSVLNVEQVPHIFLFYRSFLQYVGGFSNRMDSIGYYRSVPIEVVTILLMLIGTTNFSLLLLLFKGRVKNFCKSSEMRFLLGIMLVSIPFMTLFLHKEGTPALESFRLAFFNAFSATSTTGYATCSYSDWPQTALALMILLMIIGGGIGSTAGGMKLGRVCILFKSLGKSIKKKLSPDRTVILFYYHRGTEREQLEDDTVEEAAAYAGTYLLLFVVGTIALTYFSGCSLVEGAFEFASSLGTVGLSIGVTNAGLSSVCLLIEIAGMILGRLEIFVLLKAFCKNHSEPE